MFLNLSGLVLILLKCLYEGSSSDILTNDGTHPIAIKLSFDSAFLEGIIPLPTQTATGKLFSGGDYFTDCDSCSLVEITSQTVIAVLWWRLLHRL